MRIPLRHEKKWHLNNIIAHHNGGTKRWHEHAGSVASSACEMPTVFSDLMAPRESGAQGLISILYTLQYHRTYKLSGAKKELKSGSLVPPLVDAHSAAANGKFTGKLQRVR